MATPVEIDTKLAELYLAESNARRKRDLINDALNKSEDEYRIYGRYAYCGYSMEDIREANKALKNLVNQILPLEDEYNHRRWQRYWHVANQNGHIHCSRSCSSCYEDTAYHWRTDLSGLTEAEVVEREAYNACSVCMPIAPAEQRAAREYYNREQREQRATDKQTKKDEKLTKQAQRAIKFLAKVDKIVAAEYGDGDSNKGWANLATNYSLYGHDGKKSLYESTFDLPAQVGNYLYDQKAEQEARERGDKHMPSRHMRDPKEIIAEATKKDLI